MDFESEFGESHNRRSSSPSSSLRALNGLLHRGTAPANTTQHFEGLKHEELLETFLTYLNANRHYLGVCNMEISQALNDSGVDLLLWLDHGLIGFQIKSHFDVSEKNFSANVKRQFAESLSYRLSKYYILICAPLTTKDGMMYSERIRHLNNEMTTWEVSPPFEVIGPQTAVYFFSNAGTVSREEMLLLGAITDESLNEYEIGYEHLPEIQDESLSVLKAQLENLGDWWEFEEGHQLFTRIEHIWRKLKADQFMTCVYPQLPEDIRVARQGYIENTIRLLAECRARPSWDGHSEMKLPGWLEDVPEDMIQFTSLPNLMRIQPSLERYLQMHLEMDAEIAEIHAAIDLWESNSDPEAKTDFVM